MCPNEIESLGLYTLKNPTTIPVTWPYTPPEKSYNNFRKLGLYPVKSARAPLF
jgi:hypothetical protein